MEEKSRVLPIFPLAELQAYTENMSFEDGALAGEDAHYNTLKTKLNEAAAAAFRESAYVSRSHQRRMTETKLALSKTIDTVEHPGLTGLYRQQLLDIKTGYMQMYNARMTTMKQLKAAEWQQAADSLNQRKAVWNATVNAINRRGSSEWVKADRRVSSARKEWLTRIEKTYEQQTEEWEKGYAKFLERKADWVEDLAVQTTLAGNKYVNPAAVTASAEAGIADATRNAVAEWSEDAADASKVTENLTGGLFKRMLDSASSSERMISNTSTRIHGFSALSMDQNGIQQLVSQFAGQDREKLEHQLMVITALKAADTIKDGKNNLIEMVDNANESTAESMDDRLNDDGYDYHSTGNYYTREILEDVTAFGGEHYISARIDGYENYKTPDALINFSIDINGKSMAELDETTFANMGSRAIERKIQAAMQSLKDIRETIFGKDRKLGDKKEYTYRYGEDTWDEKEEKSFIGLEWEETEEVSGSVRSQMVKKDGEFNKHIGYAPVLKSKPDIKKTATMKEFRDTNILYSGDGQMGRIMLEYMRYQMMENRGWSEFAKPWSDRRMFDDDFIPDGGLWNLAKNWSVGGTLDLAANIALGILIGPYGPLLSLTTDAVDLADQLVRGRDAKEAVLDFGQDTAISVGSMGLNMLGLGDVVTEALGGGVLASGAGALSESVVSSQLNNSVNSFYINDDGELDFNASAYASSTFGRDALASYTGTFVGAAVGTGLNNYAGGVEAGFWKGAIDLGSSAAAKGASLGVYALTAKEGTSFADIFDRSGGLSVNIADLGTIYDMASGGGYKEGTTNGTFEAELKQRNQIINALRGKGINLNITSKGISTSLAEHSDIGLMSNMYTLGKGMSMRNWAKGQSATLTANGLNGNSFYQGIGYNYTNGDLMNLATLERLKRGYDSYEFGDIATSDGGNARGLTTANSEGRRNIRFGNLDNGIEFAVDLAHESWRDGFNRNQTYETTASVLSHTRMADAIMREHGDDVFSNRADLLTETGILRKYGAQALAAYSELAYDGSADYWKLVISEGENGELRTLVDDDKSNLTLVTESGELELLNFEGLTKEESLALITGAVDLEAGEGYIRKRILEQIGVDDVGQDVTQYLSQIDLNDLSEILNGHLSASVDQGLVSDYMEHINSNGGLTLERLSENAEVSLGLYEFMRMSGNNSQSMYDHLSNNLIYTGDKTGWYLDLGKEYTSQMQESNIVCEYQKGWEPNTTEWKTNNGIFGMSGLYSMMQYYGGQDSIDTQNMTYDHLNNQQFNITSTITGNSLGTGQWANYRNIQSSDSASTLAGGIEMAAAGINGLIASYMNGTTIKTFESKNQITFTTMYTQDFAFNWSFPSSTEIMTNRAYQNMYSYMNLDDEELKNKMDRRAFWIGWDYDFNSLY